MGATVGKYTVKAIGDTGAEISVLTRRTAKRLGLRIDTKWKPGLVPVWGGPPHPTVGTTKGLLRIKDSPRAIWTLFAVVEGDEPQSILVSRYDLKKLGLLPQTAQDDNPSSTTHGPPSNGKVSQRRVKRRIGLPGNFI